MVFFDLLFTSPFVLKMILPEIVGRNDISSTKKKSAQMVTFVYASSIVSGRGRGPLLLRER